MNFQIEDVKFDLFFLIISNDGNTEMLTCSWLMFKLLILHLQGLQQTIDQSQSTEPQAIASGQKLKKTHYYQRGKFH